MDNLGVDYYTPVGSYHGAIKVAGKWWRANNLNYLDKRFMKRWQGPPSKAIINAMKLRVSYDYKPEKK